MCCEHMTIGSLKQQTRQHEWPAGRPSFHAARPEQSGYGQHRGARGRASSGPLAAAAMPRQPWALSAPLGTLCAPACRHVPHPWSPAALALTCRRHMTNI